MPSYLKKWPICYERAFAYPHLNECGSQSEMVLCLVRFCGVLLRKEKLLQFINVLGITTLMNNILGLDILGLPLLSTFVGHIS